MLKPRLSPHQRGWRVYTSRFLSVAVLVLVHLLLRFLAFSPLIYAALSGRFFHFPTDHILAISFVFSLPLYILIAMPSRFQAAAAMASLHGSVREDRLTFGHWLKWLLASLYRLAHALPFILPFMGFVVLFYYYMRVPGFNESMLAIDAVGKVVGGDYLAGIIIITAFGIVSALFAAWGVLRGAAFEHQPVIENGIHASWQDGRKICRDRKSAIRHTFWTNVLLSLPAAVGILVILGIHIGSELTGTLIFDFLLGASMLLTFNFPGTVLIQILVVLAVLWLPLLPLRKLAQSAVMSLPPKQDKAP